LGKINVPSHYDYIGVYLTNKCFLSCDYCITNHNEVFFINNKNYGNELNEEQWIEGLNRLVLPKGIPLTLQGGEPFLHKGIWSILTKVKHPIDILTALPNNVDIEKFANLKNLDWNKRDAPYPTIRVSYHKDQNDYKDLIPRIAKLQKTLSIGLYHIDHPGYPELTKEVKSMAEEYKIDFRLKEYLGWFDGKMYGTYFYPDAVLGKVVAKEVFCKNTVIPIGPNGHLYRCHSDLYNGRHDLAITNILDESANFIDTFRPCTFYGLCSECDVKVKTNHNQQYGYTSVEIKFPPGQISSPSNQNTFSKTSFIYNKQIS
jgi:organic radical activating enzyme